MSECGKAVRWEFANFISTRAVPRIYSAASYQVPVPCLLAKDHEGPCREERDVLKQLEALDTPELARGAMRMHKL